jgi:hypothetical protein
MIMKEERILYSDNIPTLDKYGAMESLQFKLHEKFEAVYVHGAFFGYFVFKKSIEQDEIMKRIALHYGCKPFSVHIDPILFIVVDKGVIGMCNT